MERPRRNRRAPRPVYVPEAGGLADDDDTEYESEDLMDDDEDREHEGRESEDEGADAELPRTAQGYAKDGFVVSDDDEEMEELDGSESEYRPGDEDETTSGDDSELSEDEEVSESESDTAMGEEEDEILAEAVQPDAGPEPEPGPDETA
jgi:hypothetical protein